MIGTIGIGGGSKDEEMAFEALEAVVVRNRLSLMRHQPAGPADSLFTGRCACAPDYTPLRRT